MITPNIALLALRLALAATFLSHGKMKHAFWKMQPNPQMSAGMIALFKLASIVEVFAGLALLLGIFTWWAAAALAVVMLGAMYFKIFKWKSPFASTEKLGWEVDVLIIAMCLALMAFGPGTWVVAY